MSTADKRLQECLWWALGPDVKAILARPGVTDVMLNDDEHGSVWVEEAGRGRYDSSVRIPNDRAYIALCLIASSAGRVLTEETPCLSATLPGTGERIEASIPRQSRRCAFSIRKPSDDVFQLEDFDDTGVFVAAIKDDAVSRRLNIMIVGGTGSGKTSLLSSILTLPEFINSRIVVIEDETELKVSALDCVRLVATGENDEDRRKDMRRLVKSALRRRPDKIILGETRDADTTNDLLRALSTGHPGSAFTFHDDSAVGALDGLADLLGGDGDAARRRVARSVGVSIFLAKDGDGKRRITEMVYVDGWKDGEFITRKVSK